MVWDSPTCCWEERVWLSPLRVLARCSCGAGGRTLAVVLSLATLLLRRLGGPSAERRGAGLEFWGSNSSSGMTSSQRAPRKPERHTQSWGRLQEPRFWQGGWHTGLIQWLVLFAVVHPGQHCPPQTFLRALRPLSFSRFSSAWNTHSDALSAIPFGSPHLCGQRASADTG